MTFESWDTWLADVEQEYQRLMGTMPEGNPLERWRYATSQHWAHEKSSDQSCKQAAATTAWARIRSECRDERDAWLSQEGSE